MFHVKHAPQNTMFHMKQYRLGKNSTNKNTVTTHLVLFLDYGSPTKNTQTRHPKNQWLLHLFWGSGGVVCDRPNLHCPHLALCP